MEDSGPIDVLVAGAGPTGLSLAVQLRKMGASVRVVEKMARPRLHTPALAIHPRTLEVLDGLDLADPLIGCGVARVDLKLHFGESTVVGRLDELGFSDTSYPFILFVPQPLVEEHLRERLADLDTGVEWGKELDSFTEGPNQVVSRVVTSAGAETIISRYLVGCDGVNSLVRRRAGISFPARPCRQTLLVGDVATAGNAGGNATDAFFGRRGILFLFPLPSGRSRLIAVRPASAHTDDPIGVVDEHVPGLIRAEDLIWHRQVRPQRGVARRFRRGRLFLAGDAAHVHSPAGAQGMNTGIQDAVNLGWKLALARPGAEALLDTYERERRPVAIRNLVITEAAFMIEASAKWPFEFARTVAGPPLARLVIRYPALLRRVARLVSGLDIRYRPKRRLRPALRGLPAPGTRLPDSPLPGVGGGRLHEVLNGSSFQLLSFGASPDETNLNALRVRYRKLLEHHHFPSCPWTREAVSLICLVRPDGYIATWDGADLSGVTATLEQMIGPATAPLPAAADR
ncbi:MAG: FAD-dependent monooxygenase [Acidimicrobiia bacterium]